LSTKPIRLLIEEYLADCRARGLSPKTIKDAYAYPLEHVLLPWCDRVALAVGLAGPAWGSSGHDGKQATFRVDAVTSEQNFLDLGAPGNSLGDQIVFTGQLLQGDTEVGHQAGVCTVTSVQRNEAQCNATYSLRGGQITGQALITLGSSAPYAGALVKGFNASVIASKSTPVRLIRAA
jgi:hypothetical protein